MNECTEQLDNCDEFAQCMNLPNGGFECRCLEGYEGTGRQCFSRFSIASLYDTLHQCNFLQILMSVPEVQTTAIKTHSV